jgi:beta-glucosidase
MITTAVELGQLDEAILNARVADLLRVKMMLGLFDNPFTGLARPLLILAFSRWPYYTADGKTDYADLSLVPTVVNSPQHQELALEAGRKAIVLLKNDNALPLSSVRAVSPTRGICGVRMCNLT